jgi:arylsulfatase A-like enzyme
MGMLLACAGLVRVVPVGAAEPQPSFVIITVDALRADHLGCYGYGRDTSPNIDRLIAGGLLFERAWTPEPLTGPAMCSMITGLYPHQHGASRNGLRMQEHLNSLPRILAQHGYSTAAIVGTWTLKDNLTLLGQHFETYGERLERRRWLGILNSEATCEDVTDDALEWLEEDRRRKPDHPFLLWVHYIEPHAPYRFHEEYADRLGVNNDKLKKRDRYDTEIAAVDRSVGRLLEGIRGAVDDRELVIVFTADHGESLGEHGYWGHGRNLYEQSLRIPLGLVWKGRIPAGKLASQTTLMDVAPTLLELAGIEAPESLPGRSWAETARAGRAPAAGGISYFQTHRGAVHGGTHDSEKKRSKGLLSVAIMTDGRKEILTLDPQESQLFDLADDPGELHNLAQPQTQPSDGLLAWLAQVSTGLNALDRLETQNLDAETVEQLRALGYLD